MRALRIGLNHDVSRIEIAQSGRGFLQDCDNAIDCHLIDIVRLAPDLDMIVDDEGILVEDPAANVNYDASWVASQFGELRQWIYGAVVFVGGPDDKGNERELTEDRAIWLEEILS